MNKYHKNSPYKKNHFLSEYQGSIGKEYIKKLRLIYKRSYDYIWNKETRTFTENSNFGNKNKKVFIYILEDGRGNIYHWRHIWSLTKLYVNNMKRKIDVMRGFKEGNFNVKPPAIFKYYKFTVFDHKSYKYFSVPEIKQTRMSNVTLLSKEEIRKVKINEILK